MLIGGLQHIATDTEDLVARLKRLPSAVTLRTLQRTTVNHADAKALNENAAGMRYLLQAEETARKADLKKAQRHFNAAAELSRASGDTTAEAANLTKAGEAALQLKKNYEAVVCLMRACRLFKRTGASDMLYESCGLLYKALHRYKTHNPRKADKIDRRLEKIREESGDIFRMRGRETMREDAHYVGQGLVGFSSSAALGTENVCDCICLILRDPVSKRTALAHIDAATTLASLETIFAHMPARGGLEAKIIGARYGVSGTDDHAKINGRKNIDALSKALKAENVNVISCDICDTTQPLAVTVDPETFDVREELSGQRHLNAEFADYLASFTGNKEMQVAFDLDHDPSHRPIYVPDNAYRRIREIACQSPDEMYLYLSSWTWPPQIPSGIDGRLKFIACHLQEQKTLIAAAETALRPAVKAGLSREGEFAVYKLIHLTPIYIGIGADPCNAPLLSFIKNDLLRPNRNGVITLNTDGLTQVIRDMHPEKMWPVTTQPKTAPAPALNTAPRPA